jgi:hypothetical protein
MVNAYSCPSLHVFARVETETKLTEYGPERVSYT